MLAPALDEEPPLLELCITDMKDPRFDPKDYTEYEIVLVRNRKNYVNAYLGNEPTCVQDTPSRGTNAGHWLRTCDYSCLQAHWQVNYAAPQQLAAELCWKGAETLDGQTAFCGFLFPLQSPDGHDQVQDCDAGRLANCGCHLLADLVCRRC